MMRLKVCGMTSLEQMLQLDEWGVQFAGLIFYPKSPRYVGRFGLQASELRREKMQINRVGVFVNESLEVILQTVDEWRLQLVQLHGDESPKFCEQVSAHVNTIKAFRIAADDNVEWKIRPYHEFVDMYLFDNGHAATAAKPQAAYGGTGSAFDWKKLDDVKIDKPFLLSGGISPNDAERVRQFGQTHPDLFAVDVNSRFELSPGIKDMDLIRTFMDQLNQ